MTVFYQHTHDREACADCARNRAKWGPEGHCGRTHALKEGDEVRIRGGKAVWTVEFAGHDLVTVSRPRRNHTYSYVVGRTRHSFSSKPRVEDRRVGPMTDLIPVG